MGEWLEQIRPLFTQERSYLGVWIVVLMVLAVIFLTTAVILLVIWVRRRRAGRSAAPVHTAAPQAAVLQIGKVHCQGARESQQDSFSVSAPEVAQTHGVLAVVADGMGGLRDGDKVSQTAVSAIMEGFLLTQGPMEPLLWTLLERANQAVNRLLGREGLKTSGSTLVAGLVRDGNFLWMSVGDSRIYLYRAGALTQLNREHTFRRELALRAVNGEGTLQEAYSHPKAGGLTSYLGMGALKYVDMPAQPLAVHQGDKLLLMSDGVYNALTDDEMADCLRGTAEQAAQALAAAVQAKAYPTQDNYTAVILGL